MRDSVRVHRTRTQMLRRRRKKMRMKSKEMKKRYFIALSACVGLILFFNVHSAAGRLAPCEHHFLVLKRCVC